MQIGWDTKGNRCRRLLMRPCGSARRTSSPIVGPERARVPAPLTISAPSQPIYSVRYAPNTERVQPSFSRSATPKPCSFISTRSPRKSPPGAHAILILDQAGWHGAKDLKISSNLSLLPLPPRAPELNPQENIWQFMRANWLSNRIFKSFDEIVATAATRGTRSSINPGKSCPSLAAIGPSPVNHCEGWY